MIIFVLDCVLVSDFLYAYKPKFKDIHTFAQNRPTLICFLVYPPSIICLLLRPHHSCIINKIALPWYIVITGITLNHNCNMSIVYHSRYSLNAKCVSGGTLSTSFRYAERTPWAEFWFWSIKRNSNCQRYMLMNECEKTITKD